MNESERFAQMLRDVVAPRLRKAGFRGSGPRYELPDAVEWRLVAFQRSRWNDASTVEFTVNLARVGRRAYEAERERLTWLPTRPSGMGPLPGGRHVRLGQLLPAGGDRWWRIDPAADAAEVGREVAEAIGSVGLAWLVGTERHPAEH